MDISCSDSNLIRLIKGGTTLMSLAYVAFVARTLVLLFMFLFIWFLLAGGYLGPYGILTGTLGTYDIFRLTNYWLRAWIGRLFLRFLFAIGRLLDNWSVRFLGVVFDLR